MAFLTQLYSEHGASPGLYVSSYAQFSPTHSKVIAAVEPADCQVFRFGVELKKDVTLTFARVNIVEGERTCRLALTSFLRDVERAEPVRVLVRFLLRLVLRGARHVQERIGATRLVVLARRRPAPGGGLPPDLWRGLRLGQARFRAVPGPGLSIQLLLLLLAALAHRAAAGDARGLRARRRPAARRRRGLHGSREGFHTRGGGSTYRLRALRASVRSHGRDDTEASSVGRRRPPPCPGWAGFTCCIADYEISALLNVTNCEFFHERFQEYSFVRNVNRTCLYLFVVYAKYTNLCFHTNFVQWMGKFLDHWSALVNPLDTYVY